LSRQGIVQLSTSQRWTGRWPAIARVDLAPLRPAGLGHQVHARLVQAIRDGLLKPGDRLIETDLAASLQVSRTSIREALQLLETSGLVVSSPHRGTYIAEIDAADARDLYTLRALLEAHAARQLALQPLPELVARLQELVDAMADAVRREEFERIVDLDINFHQVLCSAAGNRRLLETWTGMMDQVRTLLLTKYRLYDDSPDIAQSHQVLLDACRAGDPALAAAKIEAHITETAERVLRELAGGADVQGTPR
jgi:DNA-binding GntR family transcriptional regulator